MAWPVRLYRLTSEPAEPGLCCRKDGLTLAGVPLLQKSDRGFEPRPQPELQSLLDAAYGPDAGADADNYLPGLRTVSNALDHGDLSLAIIASLLLKLPDVDRDGVERLANAEAMLKANFNPLEPRRRGRWTTGGATGFVPVQIAIPGPVAGPPAYPGNFGPRPQDDDYTFPPVPAPAQPANTNTNTQNDVRTNAQAKTKTEEPELCPPPTPESTNGRKPEEILYQRQITGLEIGCDVELNGTRFDGCDELTGDMLEAKNVNGWFMGVKDKYKEMIGDYIKIMAQAERQFNASRGQAVIWYFSDEDTAGFYNREFERKGWSNMKSRYEKYDQNNSLADPRPYTDCSTAYMGS